MNNDVLVIRRALPTDIPGIVELQRLNQKAQGGSLSGELPAARIEEMMHDMPQIVACRSDEIVAFLLITSRTVNDRHPVPVVEKTLAAYPYADRDAYIYGPVCVSEQERGQRLAQRMFQALLEQEPERQGVLFIRDDNPASLNAHRRMGMSQVGQFENNGGTFQVFAYKPLPLSQHLR